MAQLNSLIVTGASRFLNDIYAGNIHGQIVDECSRNIKENIVPMTDDEAKQLLDVEIVNFDYINGPKDQHGVIAEDVQEVLPYPVIEGNTNPSINYTKFVPYMIKMIQIQAAKIEDLEARVKELEA